MKASYLTKVIRHHAPTRGRASHATTVVLVGASLLLGCEKEATTKRNEMFEIPTAGYPIRVTESGSQQVDALVRQLVSQRPAPYRSGYSDPPTAVVVANFYGTHEVEAAIAGLKAMGPTVFPALVKHLGDERYSYSGVVAAWDNYTVGDAVVEVLDDGHYMHSGYKFRKVPSGSATYLSFDGYLRAKGAETWAEWAKTKTRMDIQMDFIDWCVAQENERGYVDEVQKRDLLKRYEDARQQMRDHYAKSNNLANGTHAVRSETNKASSPSHSAVVDQ